MITIKDRVSGEMLVREDTQVQGIINGRVYVEKGAHLFHYGMINGTVTVDKGSEAQIFGFVKGDVINNGGSLKVFGTVNGAVRTDSGETKIDKGAFIKEEINMRP
jgi:predicted acyltransferase (DUF342 family)